MIIKDKLIQILILFSLPVVMIMGINSMAKSQAIPVNQKNNNHNSKLIQLYPFSDPNNSGHWRLDTALSDEFSGNTINTNKWHVQGANNIYYSNFHGRAPSQFSTNNVSIKNGHLIIVTKWDPNYNFNPKYDRHGVAYENYTTGAVTSKKTFLYGYMEIRCKAADASVTSTFWTTDKNSELDIFEFMGAPAQIQKKYLESEFKSTIHNWAPGKNGTPVWSDKTFLNWKVADGYHVYGCEWDPNYLKFFADGKLIMYASKSEIGKAWIITHPLRIWVSSATWTWNGLPPKSELPAFYDIDYIRVWHH